MVLQRYSTGSPRHPLCRRGLISSPLPNAKIISIFINFHQPDEGEGWLAWVCLWLSGEASIPSPSIACNIHLYQWWLVLCWAVWFFLGDFLALGDCLGVESSKYRELKVTP